MRNTSSSERLKLVEAAPPRVYHRAKVSTSRPKFYAIYTSTTVGFLYRPWLLFVCAHDGYGFCWEREHIAFVIACRAVIWAKKKCERQRWHDTHTKVWRLAMIFIKNRFATAASKWVSAKRSYIRIIVCNFNIVFRVSTPNLESQPLALYTRLSEHIRPYSRALRFKSLFNWMILRFIHVIFAIVTVRCRFGYFRTNERTLLPWFVVSVMAEGEQWITALHFVVALEPWALIWNGNTWSSMAHKDQFSHLLLNGCFQLSNNLNNKDWYLLFNQYFE